METEVHLLCQAEGNTNLTDDTCNCFATNLPLRHSDSTKYIKLSKTTEKRISPEIRGLIPEHKKKCETSVLLFGEEKSDFSGGKKIRRKKSLQVQLHTKRTKIASSSVKPSRQKMSRKENSLSKSPNQYSVHKTLAPLCTSSSIIRKDEMLSNLYQTIYDEVPEEYVYLQELNALQKACIIFSKIRSGKIYVNDLPMIHHILKISISDSEMRKALKTIDIDAFQDALKIFCRIKGGRVATDEVAAVLDSMDIAVIPENLEEVIKHASIDSNHLVDIGDIIFSLDELQQQYEDVSIMEWSASDEATTNTKLSNVSGGCLSHRKKSILSSSLSEQSLPQKLSSKNFQHHKIMEDNDDLEFKRSKNNLHIRKFLDGIDGSSDAGFQESYSKDGINFRRSSETAEIHDSKSKPQNLKNITSLKKSLDISDIFSVPKLKKPAVRRSSSPLHHISSKEKTLALENVCEAINKLQENYIAAEELQSILPSVGITLSDKEFKKIVTDMSRNENGMVKLDDFVSALSKEQSLPEYDVLFNVIKDIDKIKGENIDYEDLNACLQNFGVYLSKAEFEKIIELTESHGTKQVNFKEFIDTMMRNTEHFSEKLLLPDTIENPHDLGKGKMSVSDLWNTLSSLNSNLKKDEFLAALKLATVDEDDKVQIEEFAKAMKNMHDASRSEELQEVVLALDLLEGNTIPGKNMEGFLRNTGIRSPKEEVEKILQSDFVSDFRKEASSSNLKLSKADGGKVDTSKLESVLGNLMIELTPNKHSNLLKTLPANGGNVSVNKLDTLLENMGINLTGKEFMDLIEKLPDDDEGKIKLSTLSEELSTILGKKIDTSNLKTLLENMRIKLTEDKGTELLTNLPADAKGKVYMNRRVKELRSLEADKKVFEQKLLKDMKSFKGEKLEASDFKNVLGNMGLQLTEKEQLMLSKTLPAAGKKVSVSKLDALLKSMGIQLEKEDLEDLLLHLPVDNRYWVVGKVMTHFCNRWL